MKYARHVDGLGGALRKIADQQARRVRGLASAHAASLAHLLLSGDAKPARSWRHWLATHPTLPERLARLYGRALPDDELLLAADAVPLDAAEPDDAPALPVSRMAPPPGSDPGGLGAGHRTEAQLHDAMQVPAFHDAGARAREALERIARWHGPGEWQAAMLALCIAGDDDAPGMAGRWRAYQAATADLTVGTAVRAEIGTLDAAQRRRVCDQLLARGAAAPAATRRQLWQAWSRRWREMEGRSRHAPPQAWRALVIRHGLGAAPARPARGSLVSHAAAVHAATRHIVRCFGVTADEERAWHVRALAALQAMNLPPPRGPAAGLAPAVTERALGRALRVRQLSPMQRPLLLRAWVDAAQATNLLGRGRTADALHLACTALQLPLPDALRRETSPQAR